MWERFSYYGMRALLMLYLSKQLGFSDVHAGYIYGTYTGLVYLTPIFGGLLAERELGRKNREPSTPIKFALGFVLLGLGFLVIVFASYQIQIDSRVPMLWLISLYFFHTIGELFLSPVGLSMVSRLAPIGYTAILMGFWFTSTAIAQLLGGSLSGLMANFGGSKLYQFFAIFVATSFLMALLLFISNQPIQNKMNGNNFFTDR